MKINVSRLVSAALVAGCICTESSYGVTVQDWTGAAGTDDGLVPENWSGGASPFGVDCGIRIGLPNGTNVTLTATSSNRLWTNATVVVESGAALNLVHGNFSSSVIYVIDSLQNSGRIAVGTRSNTAFSMNVGAGSVNEGDIDVTTSNGSDSKALMVLLSPGVFANNGRIALHGVGLGTAAMQLGDKNDKSKNYFVFSGTGEVALDAGGKLQIGGAAQVLTNDAAHAISGAGVVSQMGLNNLGLVRAEDVRAEVAPSERMALEFSCQHHQTTANAFGSAVRNHAGGRMVAMESSGGLVIGHATNVSTFSNDGLLEARTGSKIEIREGATEATGKAMVNDVVHFGGDLAGDGTIVTHRPVEVRSGAVIRPGNLSLNANGEDDGLGESTAGTLSFTTNVTLKSGVVLEIQSDAATRKVDGIVVAGALAMENGVKLRMLSDKAPSGTFHVISAREPLQTDALERIVFEQAEGAVKAKFSVSSHVVLDGEDEVVWYDLDATFSSGFAIIIR